MLEDNNLNENVRPPPVESKKALRLLGEPSSSNLANILKPCFDQLVTYLVCAIKLPGRHSLVGLPQSDR